jgi:predicted CoA-binding protein
VTELTHEAERIDRILETCRTVAVVGLSPQPERDSHRVARYLQEVGYRIIPVNPRAAEVLGERSYANLDEVPGEVDLVDVFRRPEEIPGIADSALRKGVRAFWMQLGIRHPEAARRLREAGIDVVEDRCALVEHRARAGRTRGARPGGTTRS